MAKKKKIAIDFSSFDIKSNYKYIHSVGINFKTVLTKYGETTFIKMFDNIKTSVYGIIDDRIAYLKQVANGYVRKNFEGKVKPSEALEIINKEILDKKQDETSLFGLSSNFKYEMTYRGKEIKKIKKGNLNQYLKRYDESMDKIVAFVEKYIVLAQNRDFYQANKSFQKLETIFNSQEVKQMLDKVKSVRKHKDGLTDSEILEITSNYNKFFNLLRANKQIQAVQELNYNTSLDGMIGYLREIDTLELFDPTSILGKAFKGQKGKVVGSNNSITVRADSYLGYIEGSSQKRYVGINVKSYQGKGYSSNYEAKDYLTSLKNMDRSMYNWWIYLNRNIQLLTIWDASKNLGPVISSGRWKQYPTIDLEAQKAEMKELDTMFSQIYNLAGFLDAFLIQLEKNKFIPEWNSEQEKIENSNIVTESIITLMNDKAFWTHELLISFLEKVKKEFNKNPTNNKKSGPGFEVHSTLKDKQIVEIKQLRSIYNKKLKNIKKTARKYSEMYKIMEMQFNSFDAFDKSYVERNYYTINPYKL